MSSSTRLLAAGCCRYSEYSLRVNVNVPKCDATTRETVTADSALEQDLYQKDVELETPKSVISAY